MKNSSPPLPQILRARLLGQLIVVTATLLPLSAFTQDDTSHIAILTQEPDGHPWSTHEFRAGARILKNLLQSESVTVETVDSKWNPDKIVPAIEKADSVVLFVSQGGQWIGANPRYKAAMQALAQRGGGITVLHWAVGAKDARYIDLGKSLWGGVHGGPDRQYTKSLATMVPNTEHPITAGLDPLNVRDEWYHHLKFTDSPGLTPLWTVEIEGEPQTVSWCWDRPDGGRSFGFVGLHFHQNWLEPTYRTFVSRGVLWTLGKDHESLLNRVATAESE